MKDEIAEVGEVDKRYIAVDIVIAIDWYASIHIENHIQGKGFIIYSVYNNREECIVRFETR